MFKLEAIFFWASIFLYVVGTALVTYGVAFRRERRVKAALIFVLFGFLCQTGAVLVRWYYLGYPPARKDYEEALIGSWTMMAIFLILAYRNNKFAAVGMFMVPFSFLMMGYGFLAGPEAAPFGPAYKSPWLYIHLFFAWVAFGAFALTTALATFYLIKARKKPIPSNSYLSRLPPLAEIDELTFRWVIFGFVAEAVMIVTGAIWANLLWGRYWSWDPVETWSLVTWLSYGLYLHLRLAYGWKGSKAAWLAIVAFVGPMVSTWGVQIIPTSWHLFRSL